MCPAPKDADTRRSAPPVVAYPPDALAPADLTALAQLRASARAAGSLRVAAREGGCIAVPAGAFFCITCAQGPQVGDLNLWSAADISEHFYAGKTRALHGTHLSLGERMWSRFPHLRPMAVMVADTLGWYGFDEFGCSVHDLIGTRCDPYTAHLLSGVDYHHCCHSNLTRALADFAGLTLAEAEPYIHDVLNVFMCTGFSRETGQYIMKASPVRAGDYLEFFAEIDLIVGLSACPGGDCSTTHSSDEASCHPLDIEIFDPGVKARAAHSPPAPSGYDRSHGR